MIVLRRLGGQLIALNIDLIERVESTPDTVITLVDEKKFLVEETLQEVLQLIIDYRAYVLARSQELSISNTGNQSRPALHVVPTELVSNFDHTPDPAALALMETYEKPDPGRAGRRQGTDSNNKQNSTSSDFGGSDF